VAKHKSIYSWQIYLGFVLVVTGGLYLADQLLSVVIMAYFWPLIIVLFGVTFFVGMLAARRKGAGLAIPGTVVTVIGLLLFIQNILNLWVTWAYAWTLLISATGLGILIMNIYLKRDSLRRIGGMIMGLGLTLFVIFGVLFELILDIAGTNINSGVFLGGGLVLLGLFLIFSRPLFTRAIKAPVRGKSQTIQAMKTTDPNLEETPVFGEFASDSLSDDAAFNSLHFKGIGEVFLFQGDVCKLQMEGDQERLEKVRAEVNDGILTITYPSDLADGTDIKWTDNEQRLRFYVTLKHLTTLDLAGAGDIRAEKFQGENLSLAHSGAGLIALKGLCYRELDICHSGLGEIELEGEAQIQNVELTGEGGYQAENLRTQAANVSLVGEGSARIWVEADLNANISGAGSIEVQGAPNVKETNSGLGKIKLL
jgi:hypothetical protein